MTDSTAEQWRDLGEQFAKLADEEKNEVAPGCDPYIHASAVIGEGIRHWSVRAPNRKRGLRFEALAARAALLLGGHTERGELHEVWLERLCLDLFQQRKEGKAVGSLRFARKPGDACIIEQVCLESAFLCERLETKSRAHSVSASSRSGDMFYRDYVPWETGIPADLIPAIKHLRRGFDDAHFKYFLATQSCCFAMLHESEVDDRLKQYVYALVQMKAIIGPAASQKFNNTVARGTPSAVFKAYFDFYLEGVTVEILKIFEVLVKIALANEKRLTARPIEWAESQANHLIGSHIHQIDCWVRDVCDKQPHDPDQDEDESLYWKKWQAPGFLVMSPAGPQPYNAATAWERTSSEISLRWRKRFYKQYVVNLKASVRKAAGDMAVEQALHPDPSSTIDNPPKTVSSAQKPNLGSNGLAVGSDHALRETLSRRVVKDLTGTVRTAEAAEVFGVAARTINRWVQEGKLTEGPKRGTVTNASIRRRLPRSDAQK